MDCPCGRVPRRPSTPPWSRPLRGRAARNHRPIGYQVTRLNRRRNANASTHTRSWRSRAVANWWCSPWKLAAGSAWRPWPSYGSWPGLVRASPLRSYARPCSVHPCTVGRACWLWRRNARWLTRSWSCRWRQETNATARSHPSVTCSRMLVTPSQSPRAVFRLRASPPVPPPRGPRPASGRRAYAVAVSHR